MESEGRRVSRRVMRRRLRIGFFHVLKGCAFSFAERFWVFGRFHFFFILVKNMGREKL